MDLLLTFDDNYTQHAGVTICSLLANNPGAHTFHVISDGISDHNRALLAALCDASGSSIRYYSVDAATAAQFPVGEGTINPDLTIATYFRLFMADLLPQSVTKVLYIDCDIVVDGTLEGLWNTTFQEGKCIAALEELPTLADDGCRRMGYPPTSSYFNAGVLLVDLGQLRTFYTVAVAANFIREHHADIRYHDQDVLNALLRDRKQFFPLRYNVMDTYLMKRAVLPPRYADQRQDVRRPTVIHYTGEVKPWHRESRNPFTGKYYDYLRTTPWRDYKPLPKFTTLKAKAVYLTKHWAKTVLDVLGLRTYRYISL